MEKTIKPVEIVANKKPTDRSILVKEKSKEIIDEMIARVDMESFKALVTLGAGKNISMDSVNWYLNEWANAKYEFYLMFGNKFKYSEFVDNKISEQEMARLINDLYNQKNEKLKYFFVYGSVNTAIPVESYLNNKCGPSEQLKDISFYKEGMKLSKFFSSYFQDEAFDIEMSKLLQHRIVKGEMSLSIDPIDFLTSAINKNGWTTCASIYSGQHACGPFSVMLDEQALVCFQANDIVHDYEIHKQKFKANSKTTRGYIHFNKKDCSFAVARIHPNCDSQGLYDTEKDFCQRAFSELLKTEETWNTIVVTKRMNSGSCHEEWDSFNYGRKHHDATKDYITHGGKLMFVDPIKFVCTLDETPIERFVVGVEKVKCACCGRYMTVLSGGSIRCC